MIAGARTQAEVLGVVTHEAVSIFNTACEKFGLAHEGGSLVPTFDGQFVAHSDFAVFVARRPRRLVR